MKFIRDSSPMNNGSFVFENLQIDCDWRSILKAIRWSRLETNVNDSSSPVDELFVKHARCMRFSQLLSS